MLLAVVGMAIPLRADDVKVGGFWYNEVEIQKVGEGKIVFLSRGREVSESLAKLEAMRLSAYPSVGKTFEALDKGDTAGAMAAISQTVEKAREPWLRDWSRSLKVVLLDRLKKPAEAVEEYAQLAESRADDALLAAAPLSSLSAATPGEMAGMAARLERALAGRARGTAAEPMIKRMLTVLKAGAAGAEKPADAGAAATSPAPVPAGPAGGPIATVTKEEPLQSVIPISRMADAKDDITLMLAQGQFDKALAEVNRRLAGNETRLSLRLYQKGLAQLHLAEKSGSREGYLDAALSFMRSAVYFPKSSYAGPSRMEAGLCLSKAGDHEAAARLYRDAQLLMDEELEPELTARLAQLIAQE